MTQRRHGLKNFIIWLVYAHIWVYISDQTEHVAWRSKNVQFHKRETASSARFLVLDHETLLDRANVTEQSLQLLLQESRGLLSIGRTTCELQTAPIPGAQCPTFLVLSHLRHGIRQVADKQCRLWGGCALGLLLLAHLDWPCCTTSLGLRQSLESSRLPAAVDVIFPCAWTLSFSGSG